MLERPLNRSKAISWPIKAQTDPEQIQKTLNATFAPHVLDRLKVQSESDLAVCVGLAHPRTRKGAVCAIHRVKVHFQESLLLY